jgi:hypothetical protein
VYFIYSNIKSNYKPLGTLNASPIDWTATGYIKGLAKNGQMEGLDTNVDLIDQSSGEPIFSDKAIVLSGGPAVQVLVKYYEINRIAPVYCKSESGMIYFYKNNGEKIAESGIVFSHNEDMFVVEHFLDQKGNAVLIIYGYGGLGTFAGAKFFKDVIHPNIREYTHSYYIFHWIDSNDDSFPDLNEIDPNPVAYGN